MRIQKIQWSRDRVNHISKHKIMPFEVEQAAFDDPFALVRKLKVSDRDPGEYVYRLLGRSGEGRYIAFFFIPKGRNIAYPITARDMDASERRSYQIARRRR